ncbi:MAG: polymerase subunit gamma and tau [Microbacteriaceae bacterium]|nr:polymerase subunit gamma and tau [Microbacteriaceae bacterium]
MVTALYRRYRPETFAELIGQSQVTDPLRTALRTDRVNHAYLFSGPRGCGKTTSARILARCLNCVEGPTDTPCGVCPSCVELSRDGGGSMDVVEIDAASHNGVDDARDIRERAVFAPARDRYKIFILDEAHMVTSQGFNALLKIVEEPPEHVKFIFATTEPEKVIGTIRSRTHHYPFRLVPPAQMLEYVQSLCESEKVEAEPGVLPLVVRAGGGSVRDTLSILDQLIAGSDGPTVQYERAVALLGYTHGTLLSEVIDAIGERDAAAAFTAVDRVIQTGQDPRRFVEDLLERLRDLIIVSATTDGAAAVLRGIQQDELDRMAAQAARFGTAELSRAADVTNAALTEMTGATSPRLHLELMVARILVPASDDTERGALARVERLERRIGVAEPVAAEVSTTQPGTAAAVESAARRAPVSPPKEIVTEVQSPTISQGVIEREQPVAVTGQPVAAAPVAPKAKPAVAPEAADPEAADPEAAGPDAAGSNAELVIEPRQVTLQQVKDAWPEVLEAIEKAKRTAWMVVFTAKPLELREGNVLVLSFPSQGDVDALRQPSAPGESVADYLKQAVFDVLGFRPLLLPRAVANRPEPAPLVQPAPDSSPTAPVQQEAPELTEPEIEPVVTWATAVVTDAEPETKPVAEVTKAKKPPAESPVKASAEPADSAPTRTAPIATVDGKQRYGESVVREILGASFIEEQAVTPRVAPREF